MLIVPSQHWEGKGCNTDDDDAGAEAESLRLKNLSTNSESLTKLKGQAPEQNQSM